MTLPYRSCEIVPTQPEHVEDLIWNIRAEDKAEVLLTYPKGLLEALRYSIMGSRDTFTAFSPEGEILCIAGVAPHTLLVPSIGSPWMLTSNAMLRNRKSLLWYTRVTIERWKQEYKLLENFVDARYTQALRWAKWAGFTVEPPKAYGPRGAKLCRIFMEGY